MKGIFILFFFNLCLSAFVSGDFILDLEVLSFSTDGSLDFAAGGSCECCSSCDPFIKMCVPSQWETSPYSPNCDRVSYRVEDGSYRSNVNSFSSGSKATFYGITVSGSIPWPINIRLDAWDYDDGYGASDSELIQWSIWQMYVSNDNSWNSNSGCFHNNQHCYNWRVKLRCASNYYTSNCGTYCLANLNGCYTCDSYGNKIVSGRYGAYVGSFQCLYDCAKGTYQRDLAMTGGCAACGAGTYQDLTKQTSCKSCSAGYYQDATGQSGCKACPLGQYQSSGGQSSCIDCPAGKYADVQGLSSCKTCNNGISHCASVTCTTSTNQKCTSCSPSTETYLQSTGSQCTETCDYPGLYCYPGKSCVTNDSGRFCVCQDYFEGIHCEKINATALPKVDATQMKFSGQTVNYPDVSAMATYYSNSNLQTTTVLKWDHSNYFAKPNPPSSSLGYVTDWKIGIADVSITALLNGQAYTGTITTTWQSGKSAPTKDAPHEPGASGNAGSITMTPKDGDVLLLRVSATNGGYVSGYDRTWSGATYKDTTWKNYFSTPRTTIKEYKIMYDFSPPTNALSSTQLSLDVGDKTTKSLINVSWVSWVDSSPLKYTLKVCPLDKNPLTETQAECTSIVTNTASTATQSHTLSGTGLWSFLLDVIDAAGNVQRARRFVLYDSAPTIAKTGDIRVTSASPLKAADGLFWQTQKTSIQADWTGVFSSANEKWLNAIDNQADVQTAYDEPITGAISRYAIANIDGIVRFDYQLTESGVAVFPWISLLGSNIGSTLSKAMSLVDGGSYSFDLKAYDIFGTVLQSSFPFHVDTTIPILRDLSLARNGVTGLVIHNSADLQTMTVVFTTYDAESKLEKIEWSLYGYSNSYVLSSSPLFPTQSVTPNNSAMLYALDLSAVHALTQVGLHNKKYQLKVQCWNYVGMTDTVLLNITADATPPSTGIVYDNLAGDSERDWQSSLLVEVSWSGFNDPESGVRHYMYAISTSCLTSVSDSKFILTANTYASKTVIAGSKYITSVYAVNNALEPSAIVCSDGVFVDSATPVLQSISIENVKVAPGYAKSSDGKYWLINSDLTRVLLTAANETSCSNAPVVADMTPFPIATGSLAASTVCAQNPPFRLQYYQHVMELVNCSWIMTTPLAEIADFEFGLSTAGVTGSMTDPAANVMAYRSTNRGASFIESHSDLTLGKEFYILIKVRKCSGLSKVFSLGPILVDYTEPSVGMVSATLGPQYISIMWNGILDAEEVGEQLYYFVGLAKQDGGRVDNIAPFVISADPGNQCASSYAEGSGCASLATSAAKGEGIFQVAIKTCNYAGLCSYSFSQELFIQSLSPPTQGIVEELVIMDDIEPDTDFQTSTTTVNIRWRGFAMNHSSVSYQVALGTGPLLTDTRAFTAVPSSSNMFSVSATLTKGVKYFATVKATNAYGTATSGSDGVVVVDLGTFGLNVQDGKGCSFAPVIFEPFGNVTLAIGSSTTQLMPSILRLGKRYTLRLKCASLVALMQEINVNDGGFLSVQIKFNLPDGSSHIQESSVALKTNSFTADSTYDFAFFALQDQASVILELLPTNVFSTKFANSGHTAINVDQISVLDCIQESDYESLADRLTCNWELPQSQRASGGIKLFTYYEWSIEMLSSAGIPSLLFPFRQTPGGVSQVGSFDLTSEGVVDFGADSYRCVARACHPLGCYADVRSDGFTLIHSITPGDFSASYQLLEGSRSNISLNWESFLVNENTLSNGIEFYAWAIGSDTAGHALLTPWMPVISTPGMLEFNIQSTVNFSVAHHDFSAPLVCLLVGYSRAGDKVSITTPLIPSIPVADELKASVLDVISVPSPTNPLSTMVDLQYSAQPTILGAVWPRSFLKQVPTSFLWSISEEREFSDCSDLNEVSPVVVCGTTRNRYMLAGDLALENGHRYFVCVRAVVPGLDINQPDLTVCSNGVTIDQTPPTPGKVYIGHPSVVRDTIGAFESATGHLSIHWHGFSDVDGIFQPVYHNGILRYDACLGSGPGDCDVVPYTDVGSYEHHTFLDLALVGGRTYFASVKAYDFIGQFTVVTSAGITIDTSPPVVGTTKVSANNGVDDFHMLLEILWQGFTDPESDVVEFLVGIGSTAFADDILTLTSAGTQTSYKVEILISQLLEGHTGYVSITAINGAGLVSHQVVPVEAHLRPPMASIILDGPSGPDLSSLASLDTVSAHWNSFYSPTHSISSYEWGIGTLPGAVNVAPFEKIPDLSTSFTATNLMLSQGHTYYVSIRGCDTHGLCTIASSDGFIVDVTPPLPGIVFDGTGDMDADYQFSDSFIGAKWFGFFDPESQLDHFEWCIGASRLSCDKRAYQSVGLANEVTDPMFNFPSTGTLYITIKAVNTAGLFVTVSSDGLALDTAPPTVTTAATWVPVNAISDGPTAYLHQTDRSVLKGKWKFTDQHGGGMRYSYSISTHTDSDGIMEESVVGSEDGFVMAGISLSDGNQYFLTATACDAANLCTTSQSGSLLVDSSPPYVGTFVDTMSWTSTSMTVKFQDFGDPHSGLFKYYVYVGTSYGGQDVAAPQQTNALLDNHQVVKFTFTTSKTIASGTTYYVTLEAINGVGLASSPLCISVVAMANNVLEIERHSCTFVSCSGACTCGPHGLCPPTTTCTNATSQFPVSLRDGLSANDIDYQASFLSLAAQWSSLEGYRAEYSVGRTGFEAGTALFPGISQKWIDLGSRSFVVFRCSPLANLMQDISYTFYLRVWYTANTYCIYASDGVTVDKTPPEVSSRYQIQELFSAGSHEVDHVTVSVSSLIISWASAFVAASEEVGYFEYSIGTAPGASDYVSWTAVGTSEQATLTSKTFTAYQTYYSSVRAVNNAGLSTLRSSDGFYVDGSAPIAGIVVDGYGPADIDFQQKTDSLTATWFGFHDLESAVVKYMLSIGTTKGGVNIYPLTDIGVKNSHTVSGLALVHNAKYYVTVRAYNNVGLYTVASSDGVLVDTTPLVSASCDVSGQVNLAKNPSFESGTTSWVLVHCSIDDHQDHKLGPHALKFGSPSETPRPNPPLSRASQVISTVAGSRYFLSFYATVDSVSIEASQILTISAPGVAQTISLRREIVFDPVTWQNVSRRTLDSSTVWQHFSLHFTAAATSSKVEFSSAAKRFAVLVDLVSVQKCVKSASLSPIYVGPQYQTAISDIRASWQLEDLESGISEFMWAIGTTPFGQQLQSYASVGRMQSAVNPKVALVHNSSYYVSVVGRNGAGQSTRFLSDEVMIDHSPPIFDFIVDGLNIDDQTHSKVKTVSANWMVHDAESGIESCAWSAGTEPGVADIFGYSAPSSVFSFTSASSSKIKHGTTVFVTVRCRNKAGMLTEASTNGVRFLLTAPSDSNALLKLVKGGDGGSFYRSLPGFQAATNTLQAYWDGFESDELDISSYEVRLQGTHVSSASLNVGNMRSVDFRNISLDHNATYTLSVRAQDKADRYSNFISTSITIDATPPNQKGQLCVSWVTTGLRLNWTNLFEEDLCSVDTPGCVTYYLSAGIVPGGQDTVPLTMVTSPTHVIPNSKLRRVAGTTTIDKDVVYYITLTAVNNAGLATTIASKSIDNFC